MPNSVEQAVQIEANRNAISAHEQVCAERYARIEEKLEDGKKRFDSIEERFAKRIVRMERLLYAIAVGVVLSPGVSAELVKKFLEKAVGL